MKKLLRIVLKPFQYLYTRKVHAVVLTLIIFPLAILAAIYIPIHRFTWIIINKFNELTGKLPDIQKKSL